MSFEDLRSIARGKLAKAKEEEEEQIENKSDSDGGALSLGEVGFSMVSSPPDFPLRNVTLHGRSF